MKNSIFALLLVAVVIAASLFAFDEPARAQTADPTKIHTFGTYTGSISATNAAIGSLVAADKQLVVRSIQVYSTVTGVLTFTDGSSGSAKLCLGVLADTPRSLTPAEIGAAGIPLTKGAELYVNALSSATVAISFSGTLE
jgi:hypothetical protein